MEKQKMCQKCKRRKATAFIYKENGVMESLCMECYKTPYTIGGRLIEQNKGDNNVTK